MMLHHPRLRTRGIGVALAMMLLSGLAVAPLSHSAVVPSASISQAKARAVEFQRVGLLGDVQEQLAQISAFNPAEGAAFAAGTDFWNSSLSSFQITGDADPTKASGIPDGLPNLRSHVFVVLGHVLNNDGTPSQQLINRVQVAKAAADKYPNSRIMVTGGQPRNGNTEGQVMQGLLRDLGVDDSRIIVENQSSDTPDNATMSMAILYGSAMTGADRVDSVSLITAGWHMRRGTVLYQFASRLAQARNGYDHLIEVKNGAACMTSNCQNSDYVNPPGYPGANERNLIAQNVAKVAGVNVGGTDGNGGELASFRTGTNGLRRSVAKFVYLQREGFKGDDASPRNNVLDLRRAIDELGDVSSVYGKEFGALNQAWDQALRQTDINDKIPTTGIPGTGHAFVVLGADSGTGTKTSARLDKARDALKQYPGSIAVLAGNQAEINAGNNGLITRGIPTSRIVLTQAGTNAQTGAFQTANTLYSLGNITTFTIITSPDYVRRPSVLFPVADILRRNAWGANTKIQLLGHIVETASGATPDSGLPSDSQRNQIIDNVNDLFDFSSSDFGNWNNPAPVLSTLTGITATPPVKTHYVVGDPIDRAGLKVQANVDNGTTRTLDITDLATVATSTVTAGQTNIEVSYTYRGTTRSTQVPITVRSANADSLVAALDEAAGLSESEFTAESYATLAAAVAQANTVVGNLASTTQEVAAALSAVQAARAGLIEVKPTVHITLGSPHADGSYVYGAIATITATPSLPDRPVAKIEYATTAGWQVYGSPVVLPVGTYELRARATDSTGITSGVESVRVTVKPLTPSLTLSTRAVKFGTGGKATVTVRANGAAVTSGTVTLRSGSKNLGTGKVIAGRAVISLNKKLAVGKYPIVVSYTPAAGTPLKPVSVSKAGTVSVTKVAPKKISVKRLKGKAKVGNRLTIRVRVSPVAGAKITGKVTVKVGGKAVGTAKVGKAGKYYQAKVRTKKLVRKGKLQVTFAGNSTYLKTTAKTKVAIK